MSAQRFSTGKQFSWQSEVYEVRRLLPGHQLTIANLQTGQARTVTHIQLYQALVADELHFVFDGTSATRTHKHIYVDLTDCPDELRRVAEYRFEVICPLLTLPSHERHQAIKARVTEFRQEAFSHGHTLETAISKASVYRWLSHYIGSGYDIRALIPDTQQRGRRKKSRLKAEVEAIIQTAIDDFYYVRETRTIDFLYYEIAVRLKEENQHRLPAERLDMPSRSTVFRRVADRDPAGKLIAKRGKQVAKKELTAYGETEYPTMPLERVEIDHTSVDLIVIDEEDLLPLGRLTLTYCLDTATRYPLGYYLGFEPPSYLAVMECLYHAILPKMSAPKRFNSVHDWQAYGVPFKLVIDNGKEFIGRSLDDACLTLGIGLERMPVKTPHFKATVERMFGTINTGVLHSLPGTTFANVEQRGDYQSLTRACISQSDLDAIMHVFLLDKYAEGFHRGLQGVPARRWEIAREAGFFPRVPASAKDLRILLGRVAYRTIQPYGIELHALRYQSSNLTSLRTRMRHRDNRQVKLKFHPADLSRIYVYDPDEQKYIEVPALAQKYTANLSLWKHQVIRTFVLREQDTVDIVALGEAQRKIQAIVEKSLNRKKLNTRAKIARWKSSGKTPSLSKTLAKSGTDLTATEANQELGLSTPELDLDPNKLETEGWGVMSSDN